MKTRTNNPQRIVITGGPGIGKTSILNVLESRGYQVVPEAARIIIEKSLAEGSYCLPWKNAQKFQEEVVKLQLDLESKIQGVSFHDRGIVDGHGYGALDGIVIPQQIFELGRERYSQVFIPDPLKNYENDSARKENAEFAKLIHKAVTESYKEFGYKPIRVPVMGIEERAEFILDAVKGNSSNTRKRYLGAAI